MSYCKKGAQVLWKQTERRQSYYGDWYDHETYTQAVIIEQPRDYYGRFAKPDEYYDYSFSGVTAKIKTADKQIITVDVEDLVPNRLPPLLSDEELTTLWEECSRFGFLYYSDYRNSVGVFERVALYYFEGFWEYLVSPDICDYSEEEAEKHYNVEEFIDYCHGIEAIYEVAA